MRIDCSDKSKPDGAPRKLMSGDKLKAMGWSSQIAREDGVRQAYSAFLKEGVS